MAKKYLLVCEGPSDIAMFECIAQSLGGVIEEHSPRIDATTQSYPPQGWTAVRAWCQNLAKRTDCAPFIKALLSFRKADGLIIHIDSDVAPQVTPPVSTAQPGDKAHCETAVRHWLGPLGTSHSISVIIATHCTETWIAATYTYEELGLAAPPTPNYEAILDAQDLLISIGYKKKRPGQLEKSKHRYKLPKYGPRVAKKLAEARSRCPELEKLASLF